MASTSGAAPERRPSQNSAERDPDSVGGAPPECSRAPPARRDRSRHAPGSSCPSLGTLAGSFLVAMSLYAGLGLLWQHRLERSTGLETDALGRGAGDMSSAGWGQGGGAGNGEDELWWKRGSVDPKGNAGAASSRGKGVGGALGVARRVAAASWHLHALVRERLDDSLAMLDPAMRLLREQETAGEHQLGRLSPARMSGWVLRVGHWVRPAPPEVEEALSQGQVPSIQRQMDMYPSQKRLFLPCARQYTALDDLLTQPHGCSPGERRYFYSGVWMDWTMLNKELSRPGGGGGHNYNDAVCVIACVDRPQPLCASLRHSSNRGGAFGFPCVLLLALRQQRNTSADAKELADVFEAEMPLPWIDAPSLQGPRSPRSAQAQEQAQGGPAQQAAAKDIQDIQDIQDSLDPDPQGVPGRGGAAGEAGEGGGSGKEGAGGMGGKEGEGGSGQEGYGGAEGEYGEGGGSFAEAGVEIGFWKGALLDAGAGIGIASIFLAIQYPGRMIVSLEESPLAFKMLRHNAQTFPSIVPWNAMLWPPSRPAQPAQSMLRAGPAKPPPALPKVGPLVEGSFLLKIFGFSRFDVVRLNMRRGGEAFIFPPKEPPQPQRGAQAAGLSLFSRHPTADPPPPPLADDTPSGPKSLEWLDSAQFVVVYQQLNLLYQDGGRERDAVIAYFTQSRLQFEPLPLRPEMLRRHSEADEDLPLVFAKRGELLEELENQ